MAFGDDAADLDDSGDDDFPSEDEYGVQRTAKKVKTRSSIMRVLFGEDKSPVGKNLHGICPLGSTPEPLQNSRGGSKTQSLRKQGRVQRRCVGYRSLHHRYSRNRRSTFDRNLHRTSY